MTDPSTFAQRRGRFFAQLGGAAAVIPAAPLAVHHADCEWPFRQNSDFWYLTGFDEPEAVALFLPHRPEGERFVLFVAPKEPSAEVWHGFRWGCEGAVAEFGADLAHPRQELAQRLPGYLKGAEGIAFRVGKHPQVEPGSLRSGGPLPPAARAAAAQGARGAGAPARGGPHLRRGP
jgi:Xaa-Pro aminopeptidase